ncbi:DUF6434 domain-containing protein [Caballeronia hypogeia]|uniref:DUF6434 domain-containing protein n=1 Tax=Caballeronia hypogeia TaxID=1777140 RepID=UPI0009416BE2
MNELTAECGETFRLDRAFMAWIKSGVPQNMGEVADEWIRLRKIDVKTQPHVERIRQHAASCGRP